MSRYVFPLLALFFSTLASELRCQAPGVIDSAGIRWINLGERRSAPRLFSLSQSPVLRVGGTERDANIELDSHNGAFRAVRQSNGNIVIADVNRLQMFDRWGKRVAIIGREGSGPGEFRSIVGLCRTRGDTLVVSDINRRVTVIDAAGKFVRTFLVRGLPPEGQYCFADGAFVVISSIGESGSGKSIRLSRVALDGAEIRQLGQFDWGPFDLEIDRSPSIVAGAAGFYFGNALRNELAAFDDQGRRTTVIRMSDPLRRITDIELERGPRPHQKGESPGRARPAAQLNQKTWPAYRRIEMDPSGRIWIQDWVTNRDDSRFEGWTAIDRDGGLLVGRLEIPRGPDRASDPMVIAFGTEEVLLRETDKDGAFSLVIRSLIRADPSK